MPFAKVLVLPIILTLLTIFLATTGCLLPIFPLFLLSLLLPKNVTEAFDHPRWQALEQNKIWELVPLPFGKKAIGCCWVYAINVRSNGEIDRLKLQLVTKGYTKIYGFDYNNTFPPIAKMIVI